MGQEAKVNVTTDFRMKIIGPVTPATDLDFDIYAQMTNIAFSHGRAIFHELTKGEEFGTHYVALRPHADFVKTVREASFTMNN